MFGFSESSDIAIQLKYYLDNFLLGDVLIINKSVAK